MGQLQRLLVGRLRVCGEDVVVGLRPADAQHAPEGAHQLILQLQLLLRRGSGAAAIQYQDGVLD